MTLDGSGDVAVYFMVLLPHLLGMELGKQKYSQLQISRPPRTEDL
jgi:hypothetical protein